MSEFDVVIVGGGIAGSALAAALAPAGISVLVIERQMQYRDKVRGEYMHPWGTAEMQRLGLEEALFAAGGGFCTSVVGYGEHVDPSTAEAAAIPLSMLMPGVPGAFAVGHPQASESLNVVAQQRGAVVVRGVGDVEVVAGPAPRVRYELDGAFHDVPCRLVIGADGRQSTVRRGLGIELQYQESDMTLGGLLVRCDDVASDVAALGTEGDAHFLAFPRPNGFVRLYVARQPGPTTSGPDRERGLRDAFRVSCMPSGERLAAAPSAGPCAYVPGSDAWTDRPLADGVVLVGDAAGWSDPIIGEGLSVALRDARMVADVLRASDDWSTVAFEGYITERRERMRRLRIVAGVATKLRCTFTPEGQARRAAFSAEVMTNPMTLGLLLAGFVGPENAPAEAFEPENIERILSLA